MYDRQKLDQLRDSLEKWEETGLQKTLASMPERQEQFITTSSEPINRLYTPLDVADLDYEDDLGLPGEYPYTRGVHATLHRSKLWTMRMFAGFGTAEETNARFKYLLEQGQTGLSHRLRPGHADGLRHRRARSRWANLANAAWRSRRSRIWKSCWMGSRSTRFPPA